MELRCESCGSERLPESGKCLECGRPRPPGEPEADLGEVLEYDLAEWAAAERAILTESLAAAGVRYRWEPALTLAVPADQERETDAVVEQVRAETTDTELPPADEEWGEGEMAFEAVSQLFVAGDRLQQQPSDPEAAEELAHALQVVEGAGPPFGFDPALWQTARQRGQLLRRLLDEDAGEDDIVAAAGGLRDILRDHV